VCYLGGGLRFRYWSWSHVQCYRLRHGGGLEGGGGNICTVHTNACLYKGLRTCTICMHEHKLKDGFNIDVCMYIVHTYWQSTTPPPHHPFSRGIYSASQSLYMYIVHCIAAHPPTLCIVTTPPPPRDCILYNRREVRGFKCI
jgi:hypothetical protein